MMYGRINCTLEVCVILLASVTPINTITFLKEVCLAPQKVGIYFVSSFSDQSLKQ